MLKNQKDIIIIPMDDLGNRTTVNLRSGANQVYATDTPNTTNRYTAVGGQPLDYDAAGNLTQDPDGYRYVYDYENRTTRIYKLSGQTEIDVAYYFYDALGRRIVKVDAIASETTLYYYSDNWQVLSTYIGGSLDKSFVYGNYIDEVLVMNDGTDDFYYAHDHLYSPAAMLDNTGAVVERYEYDAYGSVQILNSAFSILNSSQYGNPYAFTGRQLDILDNGNLRIIYYGDRYYACDLGRWISMYSGNESGRGVNPYWYALTMNHYDDLVASTKNNLLAVNGVTYCDTSTGKPKIENYNQGVTRKCTQDHEERHSKQIGSCCDKYASKRKRSSKAQQAEDDRAWGNWLNNNRKVFECIAYKDSLRCGLDLQGQGCWTKAQSDEIDNYVKNARNQMDKNCTGKGGSYTACPF